MNIMNINDFSLLLKQYINSSQYNVVTISKLTDIPRSTIQKYMSGIQLPVSYEIVEKIIKLFSLSTKQKDELKKAYMIERIGYLKYQKLIKLKEIMESLNCHYSTVTNHNLTYNFNKINNFARNLEELKLMIHFVLEDALANDKQIKILMNSDNSLFDIIYLSAKNNPDLIIEQIVNFKNLNNDITSTNLDQFNKLLPLALLENNVTIKYIYGKEGGTNYYSIFPYIIISSNYIVLINSDYTLGMLVNENQQYLINEYYKKSKSAKNMISKTKNDDDNFTAIFDDFYTNRLKIKYQIFAHVPLLDKWLINIFNNQNHEKVLSFFTKRNISLYFKADKQTRSIIDPDKILNFIDNQNHEVYLFKLDNLHFPKDLIILNNQTALTFILKDKIITIHENTLCQDFLLLDSLFKIAEYCYSQDETISMIKQKYI